MNNRIVTYALLLLSGFAGCRSTSSPALGEAGTAPHDGAPRDGAPHDGAPRDGAPPDATARDGGSSSSDDGPPGSPTFGATPIFADEFNGSELWADANTSANGHWQNFTSYDKATWLEGYNVHTQARLVDTPDGARALAIESQPLVRVGTKVSWCHWAMSEAMLGTAERAQARERCRVHTAYLRSYNGWVNGVQQGPKFGPGTRFEVRVSFAEAVRPGQRFDFWLQVEKPGSILNAAEKERAKAGAIGVAYDGLAFNGTEIDVFEFGYGHRSWNTSGDGLVDLSRFLTAAHFDWRPPYDATTAPNGRKGPKSVIRLVDTLNQSPPSGVLQPLNAVPGNGAGAALDLRKGWYVFTLDWTKLGDDRSRLDFYIRADNGEATAPRYKYLEIPDYHLHDTSNDHYLTLSNEVDQAFTGFQDGVWRYIAEGPNADGHNTPTSTTTVTTANGPESFHAYPEDRMLVDWVRVYAQQ